MNFKSLNTFISVVLTTFGWSAGTPSSPVAPILGRDLYRYVSEGLETLGRGGFCDTHKVGNLSSFSPTCSCRSSTRLLSLIDMIELE